MNSTLPPTAREEPSGAPAVVAVVVAHDPGEWFDETLRSLGGQDYTNLSVLVLDAGSSAPLRSRVDNLLPSATVRRIDENPGFSAVANLADTVVDGASFLLFCHDDVVLDPATVSVLVAEAFRSNAGIVGPKLVDASAPRLLQSVGFTVDRTGRVVPWVDAGELDQSQHDVVRDTFAVSDACLLVRSDLFHTLGGFDPAITYYGADLDLCWRAQVAGARIVVAPRVAVRHRGQLQQRRCDLDERRLTARHAIRTRRAALRLPSRWVAGATAWVFAALEILTAILSGHWARAGGVVSAWAWNTRHHFAIRRKRKVVERTRCRSDRQVARLQARSWARVGASFRRHLRAGEDRLLGDPSKTRPGLLRAASLRTMGVVLAVLALVLVVGSRILLVDGVPAVGSMQPVPADASELVDQWRSGAPQVVGPPTAPSALGALAAGVVVTFGAADVLRQLLILGLLPLGVLGAWRLADPIGSRRARLVTTVAYTAIPVGINALATGRWSGLAAYGLAPWILRAMARASGLAPFGPRHADADLHGTDREVLAGGAHQALSAGLLAATLGLWVPTAVILPLVLAAALVVGGILTGSVKSAGRLALVGGGASLLAAVLLLPETVAVARSAAVGWLLGPWAPAPADGADHLLRFETGPHGSSALLYGFLLAGFLPVLIGRRWRLGWASRAWMVVLCAWVPLWLVGQGAIAGLPAPEVVASVGAAALALACGLGAAAFEVDLSGYRFSWRQFVSVAAAGAFVVAVLPFLGAAADGRWGMPDRDTRSDLAALERQAAGSASGTVWLGAPGVLPVAGSPLDGVVVSAGQGDERVLEFGITDTPLPSAVDAWPRPSSPFAQEVEAVLRRGLEGDTSRLGSQLAPLGIRYVVVVDRLGPAPYVATAEAPVPEVVTAIGRQLDLVELVGNPAMRVYSTTEDLAGQAVALPSRPTPSSGRDALLLVQSAAWALALGALVATRNRAERRARRAQAEAARAWALAATAPARSDDEPIATSPAGRMPHPSAGARRDRVGSSR